MIKFIKLRIFNQKNEMIHSKASRSKRRIMNFIEANDFQNCRLNLRVRYPDGMTNEGSYKTKKDLLLALHAFTESGL